MTVFCQGVQKALLVFYNEKYIIRTIDVARKGKNVGQKRHLYFGTQRSLENMSNESVSDPFSGSGKRISQFRMNILLLKTLVEWSLLILAVFLYTHVQ